MTPGFTLHTSNRQPPETRGKWVKYRLFDSERMGAFLADDLNWRTEGHHADMSGRIFEYQVLKS